MTAFSRLPRHLLLPLLLMAVAGVEAASQTVLQPDDIGIVTTDGFWRLPAHSPGAALLNHLPANAFGGLPALTKPAIEWEPGSDSFLVCTGSFVFRVRILSPTAQAVTDLTPNLGGQAQLSGLDIHPGTGEMFVRDGNSAQVFRFAPPFAAGMTPDLVLPTGPGVRAACLNSSDNPPSVVIATSSLTSRLPLDGSAAIIVTFAGGNGLDSDPQHDNRTLITSESANTISVTTDSPMVIQDLNVVGLCAPVVFGPSSVAYNPIDKRSYVFATGGLNPACFPGGSDINQVVSFPPALNPQFPPVVLTDPADSGITGEAGEISLVLPDFAFPAPYGFTAASPVSGKLFTLEANSEPLIGNSGFVLQFRQGPPLQPVFLLLGAQPLALPLPSGSTVLVLASASPFLVGTTAANGLLNVPAALGPGIPIGISAYLQGATKEAGQPVLSNGLQLHFAP